MENEVEEAAVVAAVDAVQPVVDSVAQTAALNIHALCDEAIVGLDNLFERVREHPDAAGLRSTLMFVKGRFVAEKEQFWK